MSKNDNDNNNENIHPLVKEWVQMETRRQFFSKGMNIK